MRFPQPSVEHRRRQNTFMSCVLGNEAPTKLTLPLATHEDDNVQQDCRGRHRWTVVEFDFENRATEERCSVCGLTETRGSSSIVDTDVLHRRNS